MVRLIALVVPASGAALAFLAWAQGWVAVTLDDGRTLIAGGDTAAPAIPPFALAILAVIAALALAGPVFRVILGVLQALLGACIVFSGMLAILDPVQASTATITEATGIEGIASVRSLVAEAALSVWPSVAIAAGALAIVAGVMIVATASRWPARTRRYDPVRLESGTTTFGKSGDLEASGSPLSVALDPSERLDAWDALSDGGDPTTR